MIHGDAKSFFPGSSGFLRGLSKAKDYCDQRVTVKRWMPEKSRWVVQLYQPQFENKQVLSSEENLDFDHFAATEKLLPKIPPDLSIQEIEGCGESLSSKRKWHKGEKIFDEYPMMVVRNGNNGTGFEARWNLIFGTETEMGPNAPVMEKFTRLSDGGLVDEYREDAKIMFHKMMKMSMSDQEITKLKSTPAGVEFVDTEVARISGVLARWQTNSHAFPLRGADEDMYSALFFYTAKMLHSCEPNCICTVDPVEGVMTVRAIRDIEENSLLTSSYMGCDGEFHTLDVEARRARLLKERHFFCMCSCCKTESAAGWDGKNCGAEVVQLMQQIADEYSRKKS